MVVNAPVAYPGEYGAILGIQSSADGAAVAATDRGAAGSSSAATTFGTVLAEVQSAVSANTVTMAGVDADGNPVPYPMAYASAANVGQASSNIVGVPASSSGAVVSAAVLGGTTLPTGP